jgi:glutathione S-transferase
MYQLYLNSMSPFAMKSSAMIGYAGLACEPKVQNVVNRFASIKRLTGKTMIPVLRRGEWAINDSSQIARYVMEHADRPLLPADPALGPICWLLEDFADEWVSLWMLSSRWSHQEDVEVTSLEVGKELVGGLPLISGAVGRLAAIGIQKVVERAAGGQQNQEALDRSRDRLLQALEACFEASDEAGDDDGPEFLFDAYPTLADFALYGQLSQYGRDPSGNKKMRLYPGVRDYLERIDRMTLPHPTVGLHAGGPRDVSELAPIFAEFLGTYWRVLVANHRAYHRPKRPKHIEVELLDGESFSLRPSGYFVGRLEFVLSQLNRAYAEREELFGGKGLEIEHALIQQVGHLTEDASGRQLLREYPHIGKPAS